MYTLTCYSTVFDTMIKGFNIFLLFLLAVSFNACKDKKANDIPVGDFFNAPEKSNFKISPDGAYVAFLKLHQQKQNIFIRSLKDNDERRATSFSDFNIRDFFWTFDNQIIFGKDNFSNDHSLYALDVSTHNIKTILSENKAKTRILNTNRLTPDVVSVTMNKRDSAKIDVYKLNIKTGVLTPYLLNPGNITEWFSDADGKIRLVKSYDGADETILFRPDEKTAFRPIIKNNFRNSVRPVGFTGEKNNFYALSNVGRDKTAFVEINAENGKELRVIFSTEKADIQRIDFLKAKRRVEAAAWDAAKPQKHFFDKEIQKIYGSLSKHLPGREISITGRDTAERKFLVTTSTDRSGGALYLYDRTTDGLVKLSDNSNLNPEDMCAMEPVSFYATDGLLINGYITYPQGNNRNNLPVVVMPHDGPFGQRDVWGYKPEVQFLASRGYAVLQINFRGSSGYGKSFFNAGFKELGGKMQQDITDGVNWLVTSKIANPRKIAIFGRGFGGFSALYGISFHPHLYACAVVQDAPINVFTYIKDVPSFLKNTLQRRYEMFGDPDKDAKQLKDISPVFHSGKVKAPVIIFQGGMDPRVTTSELRRYYHELQKRNSQVKLSIGEKERWSGQSDSTRQLMYSEIEKFLDEHMLAKP